VIWDLINIVWLRYPDWLPNHLVATPILGADVRWQARELTRPQADRMRKAIAVQRDAIFNDLFACLAAAAAYDFAYSYD
jgi:hypothetical protein